MLAQKPMLPASRDAAATPLTADRPSRHCSAVREPPRNMERSARPKARKEWVPKSSRAQAARR